MDKWEEVKANIRRLEQDPDVNQELLRAMDSISLADYWKRRAEEERELLLQARRHVDEQDHLLRQEKLKTDMMERSFEDKRRLWEKEREAFEEKIKVKEVEIQLLRERAEWETKFQDAVKQVGGRKGMQIPGEASDTGLESHELRRLMKEVVGLRDNTDDIHRATRWLDSQKEVLLDALNAKASASTAADVGGLKEMLARLVQQIGTFQNDLFKKLESGVIATPPAFAPAPTPAVKEEALVLSGIPNLDGDAARKQWFEQLQAYLLVQEDVARGFCHKARNLLGIISGTAQIVLTDENLAPEMKENLTTIDQNVTLLMESIEEYLAITRYPQMSVESTNINPLIQEVAVGPRFQFKLDPKVPSLNVDKKLFKEAVGFVLDNAREASAEGTPIILSTRYDEKEKTIVFSIQDQGKGIAEHHFRKIYQPYFTTKKEQRGLGLSKALHIAMLFGGKMDVESVKGSGSTLYFKFPVV